MMRKEEKKRRRRRGGGGGGSGSDDDTDVCAYFHSFMLFSPLFLSFHYAEGSESDDGPYAACNPQKNYF
jgi:hypothetical protein